MMGATKSANSGMPPNLILDEPEAGKRAADEAALIDSLVKGIEVQRCAVQPIRTPISDGLEEAAYDTKPRVPPAARTPESNALFVQIQLPREDVPTIKLKRSASAGQAHRFTLVGIPDLTIREVTAALMLLVVALVAIVFFSFRTGEQRRGEVSGLQTQPSVASAPNARSPASAPETNALPNMNFAPASASASASVAEPIASSSPTRGRLPHPPSRPIKSHSVVPEASGRVALPVNPIPPQKDAPPPGFDLLNQDMQSRP